MEVDKSNSDFIYKIKSIINKINKSPKTWSFLTSIDYMLDSKLYMDVLKSDASLVPKTGNESADVLDFGTGSGIFAVAVKNLAPSFKITGLDTLINYSQKDPNFADAPKQQKDLWKNLQRIYKIKFRHYNGTDIPFKNNVFDIITTYAVLEHIKKENLEYIVKQIKRILKKNGLVFVFRLPRKYSYIEQFYRLFGLGFHDLLFSDKEIRMLFASYSLKIIKSWKSDLLFEYPGKFTNPFYYFIKFIDNLLINTPLSYFSHYENFILLNEK